MIATRIKLKGDLKLDKKISSVALRRGIKNALINTNIILDRKITILVPKGESGELEQGIRGDLVSGKRLQITSRAPYTKWVVEGRSAGAKLPPFHEDSRLWRWVKKKIKPTKRDLPSTTFLVAREIARRGIKPNDFLDRAVLLSIPQISRAFNKHIKHELRKGL